MTAPTGDTGRARITFGDGNFYDLGPRCTTCRRTEAACAGVGCCDNCDHFGPRLLLRCGTESGYQHHRTRREASCDPCKAAHSDHNRRRA